MHVNLHGFVKTRYVAPKDVLEPTDHFHVATARGRQHVGNHVVAGMVGRFFRGDFRVAIVLRMWSGKVSAAKVVVVFLFAVVGQGTAADLTTGDSASVCERGQEDCVDVRQFT